MLIFLFSKTVQQFFYPFFVMVSAYRSFWQFKYSVYPINILIFFITGNISLICIQKEVIYIQNSVRFQYTLNFPE